MTSSAAGLASTGTQLFYAEHGGVAFKEVANVKTTPEIGATPQQIEITNLGDLNQRYDLGMGSIPVLTFAVIYKGPDWNQIYDKAGNHTDYDWKLVYPDGMYITFTGTFDIQLQAMDINTAAMYNLSVAPTDVPRFHKSASDDSTETENGGGEAMSYRPMFVKTFSTASEMNAYDPASEELIQGDFVLLNGDDADRGKVYFYNGSGFTFFANIIGPQGIQGDKGDPGLSMRMLGTKASLPAIADEGSFCFVGTTLYSYTNGQWINLGDFQGDKGETGDSAYTQAVQEGFKGTEHEWLASLKGDKGDSAYTQAVANGYSGSEADWIKSLKGDSAYTQAVANGYTGSEEQWLASLKGDKGDSAYAQAVANGFSGTEADWIKSLKGDKGDPGEVTLADLNAGLGTKVSTTDADNKYLSKTDANKTLETLADAQTAHEELSAPNLIDVATDDWQTVPTGIWNVQFPYQVIAGHTYFFGADLQSSATSPTNIFAWSDVKNQTMLSGFKQPTPVAKSSTGTVGTIFTAPTTMTIYVVVGALNSNDPWKYRHVVFTETSFEMTYAQAQANRHGTDGVDKTQDLVGGRNYVLNSVQTTSMTGTGVTGNSVGNWNLSGDFLKLPVGTQVTIACDITVSNADGGQIYFGYFNPWTVFYSAAQSTNGTTHVAFQTTVKSITTITPGLKMTVDHSKATYTVSNMKLNIGSFEKELSPAPEDKVTDNHDGSITVNNASYNMASLVSRITALEAKVK